MCFTFKQAAVGGARAEVRVCSSVGEWISVMAGGELDHLTEQKTQLWEGWDWQQPALGWYTRCKFRLVGEISWGFFALLLFLLFCFIPV